MSMLSNISASGKLFNPRKDGNPPHTVAVIHGGPGSPAPWHP